MTKTSEGPPTPLAAVASELEETEKFLLSVVASDYPFVSVLAQHLIRAGGKRLRVALAWLGGHFGDLTANRERVMKTAASIELSHLATLHHDDVIDEADARRGAPSVNANWTNTLAVLSGDYLFARSSELAADVGGEMPMELSLAIAALCEGQISEIEANFNTKRTEEAYIQTVTGKTAVLLGASAYLGARAAGVDVETALVLRQFGIDFGIAFQVADDLLDLTGDTAVTGKELGTDLKEGVYTLPVIHALGADPEVEAKVKDADLEGLVEAMRSAGSFEYTLSVACAYAERAREAARRLPESDARQTLLDLVDYVIDRADVTSAA